jgi:hypothetical protein
MNENELLKTFATMDTVDEFLKGLMDSERLTASERLALGQTRNAIADLLEELDVPYDEVVLDATGRVTSWKG